jgi:hypothetical protein
MDRRTKRPGLLCYADNYRNDVRFGVIVDVEASRAVGQAEVGAARTILERTEERFRLKPQRLAADSAYGSAPMLNWLVQEKRITPHIPVITLLYRGSTRDCVPCPLKPRCCPNTPVRTIPRSIYERARDVVTSKSLAN